MATVGGHLTASPPVSQSELGTGRGAVPPLRAGSGLPGAASNAVAASSGAAVHARRSGCPAWCADAGPGRRLARATGLVAAGLQQARPMPLLVVSGGNSSNLQRAVGEIASRTEARHAAARLFPAASARIRKRAASAPSSADGSTGVLAGIVADLEDPRQVRAGRRSDHLRPSARAVASRRRGRR